VVFIKLKVLKKTIALIFLLCVFLLSFTFIVQAQAELSIKGTPTYELTKQETVGNTLISRYNIYIIIENTGTSRSENTTINLTNTEGYPLKEIFELQPGEEKNITFEYPTILETSQDLRIFYFPTHLEEDQWNELNSGSTTITLNAANDGTNGSSPGFEIIILFTAIMLITLYCKKFRKI